MNPYSRRPPDNHLLDPLPVDWSSSCATGPLSFLRLYRQDSAYLRANPVCS